MMNRHFPFSAIVGQEMMKRALLLNVVDPAIGGVLIMGERGTAKSTGVRALVHLLPSIRVVEGCPFQCDPDEPDGLCSDCSKRMEGGESLQARERRIRLVDLPIGITEDRLLGTIDFERALKSGRKAFEPGLLAEVHRGILYVDEVNLLNDQIVDLFLDAAASGINVVEREGISVTHGSRFVLVGTMNPEEGDLRPQLLDRFGLCVGIEGIQTLPERVEIIKRRLTYERDPASFCGGWEEMDARLAQRIVAAKSSLEAVLFTEDLLETAARLAVAMEIDGHRADIVMMKAARANAALEGRQRVTMEDLQLAARLSLPHRTRKSPLKKPELDSDVMNQVFHESEPSGGRGREWSPVHENPSRVPVRRKDYRSPLESITHLCPTFRTQVQPVPFHRIRLGGRPGRRFAVCNASRKGKICGSRMPLGCEPLGDISIVGTLRAAAEHQQVRRSAPPLEVRGEDVRLRKHSAKTGLSLMLLVDSSASMRTNDRMSATKGVLEALLTDVYLKRDKVGIITFREMSAQLVVPFTQNIREARKGIDSLPVGGRTPLASGLHLGIRLIGQERRKNPESLPVLLIFSDGRPNVSSFGGDPLQETFFFAGEVRRQGIRAILVDTEFNPMSVGYGYEITQRMEGIYLTMDRLLR